MFSELTVSCLRIYEHKIGSITEIMKIFFTAVSAKHKHSIYVSFMSQVMVSSFLSRTQRERERLSAVLSNVDEFFPEQPIYYMKEGVCESINVPIENYNFPHENVSIL